MSLSEPESVLLVNGNEKTRASLQRYLELEGHRVTPAERTADALAILRKQGSEVGLVFFDLSTTTDEVGDSVCTLTAEAPQADVIVLAEYDLLERAMSALRSGAADYLLKPIHPDALHSALLRIKHCRSLEHQLQEKDRFAERVLRTAEVAVVVLDLNGCIIRINPFLSQITGWDCEEAKGKAWFDELMGERECEQMRRLFDETLAGRPTSRTAGAVRTRNGGTRSIRWSHTPLRDDCGRITAVLAVGVDVTDLIAAQRAADQSNQLIALGQSVAAFSHESRNVLQRIQARVELLEMELSELPEARRDVESIGVATRDLWALLEEIRMFAAPLALDLVATNLRDVWRHSWKRLAPLRAGRDAELVDETDDCMLCVEADPRRLEQVFRNMFENSLAAASDPVRIHIRCCENEDPSHVEIELVDNGPGLSAEQRESLFTPFFTTKENGTGLGMAIVQRIINAHGGSICAAQMEEPGAVFRITLPQKAPVPC